VPFGFYIIMAAQFFSALADNALLVAAIAALREINAPEEQEPLLRTAFTVSYVVLAAVVGAFADSMPKGRVMLICNTIKIVGCVMLLFGVHPLIVYAIVGLGAAAYAPAKYGILTEYLPHRLLVIANGWMETLTVLAIIFGVVLGGQLIKPAVSGYMLASGSPLVTLGAHTAVQAAVAVITVLYLAAAAFNIFVPLTGVENKPFPKNPIALFQEFGSCLSRLWRDKLGQISLAVTTLFWGAGATLQFILIKWSAVALGYDLTQASSLQGVVSVGVVIGAIVAAKIVSMRASVRVLPVGIAMGLLLLLLIVVRSTWTTVPLLIVIGGLSGFFVVPMNALLQHRGHMLMDAGKSIAVQGFNENLSILIMTGVYFGLILANLSIHWVIALFGVLVAGCMYLIRRHHLANQRIKDDVALLDNAIH